MNVKQRIRWQGAVLTLVAASYWPLHILAVNIGGIVRPERVVAIIVLAWFVGLAAIFVSTSLGLDVEPAENSAFVAVALAMSGGLLMREFGTALAMLVMVVGVMVAGYLFVGFRSHFLTSALVWAVAVALATGPVLTFVESWTEREDQRTMLEEEPLSIELSSTPDIFLVVLDGYPGAIAAAQDGLGVGSVDIAAELRRRGFEVPESTWSSYWATSLSIPSLLRMGYPVVEGSWTASKTHSELLGLVAGENPLVEMLRAAGYETHMVEAGWSSASCGENFDHCVPSPLIDEATYLVLRRTIAWPLLDESPGPYVLGALSAFDWLHDEAPELSESATPDFVFSHVVSPHAPFLLRPDCTAKFDPARAGTTFNVSGVTEEDRAGYLTEQMDCLDRLMIELADAVDPDDIVVFVSDHGSDRRNQSDPDMVDWSRPATVERLNNFLAVRLPQGCSMGEGVIVPNVFRHVLGCISSSPVSLLPERIWVNPLEELTPEEVESLLDMRASLES